MSYVTLPNPSQQGRLREFENVKDLWLRVQLTRELEIKIGLIPTKEELIKRINKPDEVIEAIKRKKNLKQNELQAQQLTQQIQQQQ